MAIRRILLGCEMARLRRLPNRRDMPVNVLIIEDDPTARVTLERLLAGAGFVVRSAGTLGEGNQKLEALEGHAAVILDLNLPDGNGVEILKRIRAENRPVKVLVATADTDSPVLREVEGLRPDALLTKPLDVRKLVGLLDPAAENPGRAE